VTSPFYRPATADIDITRPGGIDALLALHRGIFGGFQMVDAEDGADGADGGAGDPPALNEHGYPDKTPVKDMPVDQQAAYWRHQARKHEDRVKSMADYESIKTERDTLKTKHQTADEKAMEDAKRESAEAATAAERARIAPRLVTAEFKSANAGRIPAEQLTAILDGVDYSKFLTADGEPDADKVKQYVDGIAPADGRKWPDMGQGRRSSQKSTGVDAGRALFADRRPKK
jgi:hypothetical protein